MAVLAGDAMVTVAFDILASDAQPAVLPASSFVNWPTPAAPRE